MPGAGIEPARGFPRGIFVLTTAFAAACVFACIWSLDFTFALSRVARVRQGPSSLYTFNAGSLVAKPARLSSVLQPPRHAAVPPTLTPFTSAVSARSAQCFKSLASTSFATQAWGRDSTVSQARQSVRPATRITPLHHRERSSRRPPPPGNRPESTHICPGPTRCQPGTASCIRRESSCLYAGFRGRPCTRYYFCANRMICLCRRHCVSAFT